MRYWLIVQIVVVSLAVGGPVWAEDGTEETSDTKDVAEETAVGNRGRGDVSERDQERAQELFERGYNAYTTKEFGRALAMWRKAYEFVPEAVFLFNAAKAAAKLENRQQALALARRAGKEERRPLTSKLAEKNEKLIEELKAEIAYQRKRREAEKARKLDWRGWSGVAGMVGGSAGLGLAMGLYGQKARTLNEQLETAKSRSLYEERRSEMERQQQIGRVLLYSGAGLAAVGAGLLVWDLMDVPAMPERPVATIGFGAAGRPGATFKVKF